MTNVQALNTTSETKTLADRMIEFIDEGTSGTLTLTPARFGVRDANKEYPTMSGWFDTPNFRISAAGFVKKTEEGREYLSISFGGKNEDRFYGCIFRDEVQDLNTGLWATKFGKENDRHGLIRKNEEAGKDPEGKTIYKTLFELRMAGGVRRTRNGNLCLKLKVYSVKNDEDRTGIF